MKKLTYTILIGTLISQSSDIESLPSSPAKWNVASALKGTALLGVGTATFFATKPIFQYLLNKIEPNAHETAKYYSAMGVSGLLSMVTGYIFNKFFGPYIQDSSYLLLTRKSMIPETTHICLEFCHRHILYLKVLNCFKLEFVKLVESLDTSKYHEARAPERLNILDKAFYCLIENNFITELGKEFDAYKAKLQAMLPRISKFIEPGSKDANYLEEIKELFSSVSSSNDSWELPKLLEFLQENRMQSLYVPFSCLYTHIKLFNKGFNEGIDVIDEADKVNSLGFLILDKITFQLHKLTKKIEENLTEFTRRRGLESIFVKSN